MKTLKSPPPPTHGPEGDNLLRCADDGWRPWSIVCVHLINGESREWTPLESNSPYVEYDWCCPSCWELVGAPDEVPKVAKLVKAICVLCVQRLRRCFDPNYGHELQRN